MSQNPKITCLIEGHEDCNIQFINLQENPSVNSRFLCELCILDLNLNHQKSLLISQIFKNSEKESNPGAIKNLIDMVIQDKQKQQFIQQILKNKSFFESQNEEILTQIDTFFDNFEDQVLKILKQTRKNVKLEITKFYNESQNENTDIHNKLKNVFDLDKIRKIISDFNSVNDLEKANNNIFEQFKDIQKQYQNQDLQIQINKFQRQKQIKPVNKIIDIFEKQSGPALAKLEEFSKQTQQQIFQYQQSLQLKMFKSNYDNSQNDLQFIEDYTDQNTKIEYPLKVTSKKIGGWKVFFSDKFDRDDYQQFRFKLYQNNNNQIQNHFAIGVIKEGDHENQHLRYGNSGNAVDLYQNKNSRKGIEFGDVQVKDVYYEGMELQVDICIKENKLDIIGFGKEQQQITKYTNNYQFEDGQYYRFFISMYSHITDVDVLFF